MAEENIPESKLKFLGMVDLYLIPGSELECEYVETGLIKLNGQTIVCDLKMDDMIDRKVVKSHQFGIVTFIYFYGLGTNHAAAWLPSWSENDKHKWAAVAHGILQLTPNSELPQSLLTSCELVGERCLVWVKRAHEKTCNLCDKQLTIGDEVATLVNLNTKKLACSTRANLGGYHVFHTPCLIRWILFCDYMIEHGGAQADKQDPDQMMTDVERQLSSVLCPECVGTGMKKEEIGEFKKETPQICLSRLVALKTNASDAYTKWMESADAALTKDDKVVGLTCPALPENPAVEMEILKSLHIYQLAVSGCLGVLRVTCLKSVLDGSLGILLLHRKIEVP